MTLFIVAHGGVGTPAELHDGCARAVERVREEVAAGAPLVEAVVAGAVLLEDDPRYNAGTGSSYRLDGRTIEMDAALMDQDARIGAVAALQRVKNPILVARDVARTPHILLAGVAAQRFARARGHADHDPATPQAREKYERVRAKLAGGELPAWRRPWLELDLAAFWNFEAPYEALWPTGTIGVVALQGARCAVANSTGGASPMLAGRIGDTPLPGAGFWAGPAAAAAATGVGEEIARRLLSHWVYQQIEAGQNPQAACEAAVARYPGDLPIGMIAVSPAGWGAASNQRMAWAAWDGEVLRTS